MYGEWTNGAVGDKVDSIDTGVDSSNIEGWNTHYKYINILFLAIAAVFSNEFLLDHSFPSIFVQSL